MSACWQKAFKAVALFLVFSIVQVTVLANATSSNIKSSTPGAMIFGRLDLSSSQFILVNGNGAKSGATIFSGARLQTPEGVTATVQLGTAGKLEIAPNTDLTVTFDSANVDVRVAEGNAFLTTNNGVNGTVTLPEGAVNAALPAPAGAAAGEGGNALGLILTASLVAAAVITYVVSDDDDDNDSPF